MLNLDLELQLTFFYFETNIRPELEISLVIGEGGADLSPKHF